MSRLDAILRTLVAEIPDWRLALEATDAELVRLRLDGVSLQELSARTGLTVPGVRFRLYGAGHGGCRHGGAMGRLRGRQRTRASRNDQGFAPSLVSREPEV